MKRYVKCDNSSNIDFPLKGSYITKRGKLYHYKIYADGGVEVWCNYTIPDFKHGGPTAMRDMSRYLYAVPKEVQNYLNDEYGTQLSELGITLRF